MRARRDRVCWLLGLGAIFLGGPAPAERLAETQTQTQTRVPVRALTGDASFESTALPAEVMASLRREGLEASAISVLVVPLKGGPALISHRADESMQPASTLKVLTAAVALERLGPGWRGRTELLAAAPDDKGVVHGDWALRGLGDADLDLGALWNLLREWRDSGVQSVKGDLVVDRSWFRPARPDLLAPPFDESPEWPYNTVPDALLHNRGLLAFDIRSDAQGRIHARVQPQVPGLEIINRLTPGTQACSAWQEGWQTPLAHTRGARTWVVLRGQFPVDCQVRPALNVVDRQWVLAQLVRRWWTQLGGRWQGAVTEGIAPPGLPVQAVHQGRTVAELLRPVLKASDNPIARLMFENLGASQGAQPATAPTTADVAAQVVLDWLASQGIAAGGLKLDNGSGLSRTARISARQLAEVLQAALRGPYGTELLAALPLAGEDGSLRRRLREGPAHGRARLKTGTLFNVRALAGVVNDRADRSWVLVAMVNGGRLTAGATRALDELVERVAAMDGTPDGTRQPCGLGVFPVETSDVRPNFGAPATR
jgi:D-alanyl-D-alanine carboxypeptidase/D-alanyl-D-alanine-endopeptidase (penicillin-binding protein 4)